MLYRFNDAEREMLLSLAIENVCAHTEMLDDKRPIEGWVHVRADLLTACRIVAEMHSPTPPAEARLGGYMGPLHLSIDDDMRAAASAEGVDVERELSGFDARANDPKCVHGRKRSEECPDCASTEGAYAHKIAPHEQAALDSALIERNQALRDLRLGFRPGDTITVDDGAMPAPVDVPDLEKRVAAVIERHQRERDGAIPAPVATIDEGWLKPLWSAGDGRCNWVNESTELRCVGDEGHIGTHQVPELERVRTVMHRDSCPVSHEHFQPVIGGPSQCTCDFGQRLAAELGIPFG